MSWRLTMCLDSLSHGQRREEQLFTITLPMLPQRQSPAVLLAFSFFFPLSFFLALRSFWLSLSSLLPCLFLSSLPFFTSFLLSCPLFSLLPSFFFLSFVLFFSFLPSSFLCSCLLSDLYFFPACLLICFPFSFWPSFS